VKRFSFCIDIFGLFCLFNSCYDEIKNTIILVKKSIQRDQNPPYSLFKDELMRRSGALIRGIIGNFSITPGCIGKIPLNPPLQRGKKSECPDLLRSYDYWTNEPML